MTDSLAQEHGLMRAAVFGCVWRHCQMDNGVCTASLSTIGALIGLERNTVHDHVRALVADACLRDLTPDERTRPHTYADTGKAGLKISFDADDDGLETVRSANSAVRHSSTTVRSANKTVRHSSTKKEGDVQTTTAAAGDAQILREREERAERLADPTLEHPAVLAHIEVCGRSWVFHMRAMCNSPLVR